MAVTAWTDITPFALYDARKGVLMRRVKIPITAISALADAVFTTGVTPHGLTAGESVVLEGTNSTPTADGTKTLGAIGTTVTFKTNPAFDASGGAGTYGYVQAAGNQPALDGHLVTAWNSQVSNLTNIAQSNTTLQPTYCAGNRQMLGPGVRFLPNICDTGNPQNLGRPATGGGVQLLGYDGSHTYTVSPTMNLCSMVCVLTRFNSLDGNTPTATDVADPTPSNIRDVFGIIANIAYNRPMGFAVWRNKLVAFYQDATTPLNLPSAATNALAIVDSGLYVPNTPCVIGVSCGATTIHFRVGNQTATIANTFTSAAVPTLKVVSIGSMLSAPPYMFWGNVHLLALTASTLTDQQISDAVDFGYSEWGITPRSQLRLQSVCIGDSITSGKYGNGRTGAMSWAHYLDTMISRCGCGHESMNLGYAAKTAALTNSEYSTRIAPMIRNDIASVAAVMVGINDLIVSTVAATLAADVLAICGKLKTSGVRRVVLCAIMPGVTSASAANEDAVEVIRLATNAILAAGYTGYADDYIDLDSLFEPTIDFATQKLRIHGDSSLLISETPNFVHPTDNLQQQIARKVYDKLKPYLSEVGGVTIYGAGTDTGIRLRGR